MRKCCRCKIKKTLQEFPRDKYKKLGHSHRCKECENKRQRIARIERPEIWEKQKYKNFISQRLRKGIDVNLPRFYPKKGEGKGYINSKGYRILHRQGHPNAYGKDGSIGEHTMVMSDFLGRPLKRNENVHHINGIRDDNRIENLELWTRRSRPGQRVDDLIEWCIEFLLDYGYSIKKEVKNDESVSRSDSS